uniref:Transglutaminase 5, like n=1 Tax=Myripristis murdjan TaxID=586833 RepID=A0A667YR67_9TELE
MEDLNIQYVHLEQSANQEAHKTDGFSSSKTLVVRRGAPFRVSLLLKGRPFSPKTDSIIIRVLLGRLYVIMPVTFSKEASPSKWTAYFSPEGLSPLSPSFYISSPASASVGTYRLELYVFSQSGQRSSVVGHFILLCNPWCREDAVFVPFEDQREEFIQNDSGLLYMGTAMNCVSRPWSFDQFEPDVLEICLKLLQVSPQHMRNRRKDYIMRADPVYLSRVVSAMVITPLFTSHDILRVGAVKTGCGLNWVAVCFMRVLGIPCRVVTNFNSAHDTNGNLVIEEYYSETGQKLHHSKDSIWNFHVWVECWMTRKDLGSGMDGWQVLDPTPQERSRGVFCCGPAPVKAVKYRRIDLAYDVPFVYAEVNADVHTVIVRQGQVLSYSKDTERVGALICTKAVGHPRLQNITADYKHIKSPNPSLRSRSSTMSDDSTLRRGSSQGLSVSLTLDKAAVAGEPIRFTVKIINNENVAKVIKEHLNAQAKEYNHSPSDTFWEAHSTMRLAPMEAKVLRHQITPAQYEGVVGDDLVNLAVVLEDNASQKRVLASEEFNIASPELTIQIANGDSAINHKEHTAVVMFTNPFSVPVSGSLMVAGAGLIQGKIHFSIASLLEQRITFTPTKVGTKMLQASLYLSNVNSVIRGFKMISVINA